MGNLLRKRYDNYLRARANPVRFDEAYYAALYVESLEAHMHTLEAALRTITFARYSDLTMADVERIALAAVAAADAEKGGARKATHGDQEWIDRANAASYLAAVDAKEDT